MNIIYRIAKYLCFLQNYFYEFRHANFFIIFSLFYEYGSANGTILPMNAVAGMNFFCR